MQIVESVKWSPDGSAVRIVDQRKLPAVFVELDLRTLDELRDAISTLAVRGAPAIGVTAAMGLAVLTAQSTQTSAGLRAELREWGAALCSSRPTAVNLAWAVQRVLTAADAASDSALREAVRSESDAIRDEDRAMCRRLGEYGADLLADGMSVLTHCNTGALATAGIGTALAAIYVAYERGWQLRVYSSETRPLLQGSRLTAWELSRAGIDVTVVGEGAVASLMRSGAIDCCIVGADRITRNGDVANKIGTYSHAVSAHAHGVPFFVSAPRSTVDTSTRSGADIPIEQRDRLEVLRVAGHSDNARIHAINPAFDVTPAHLIAAIVTDAGIHRAPYDFSAR